MFWEKNNQNDESKSKIERTNESKQLALQILQLQNHVANLNETNIKIKGDFNRIVKSVEAFCQVILDRKFAESQLGGFSDINNADIFKLLDITQKYYKERLLEDRKLIISLTETLNKKDFEIENLKSQISQMMIQLRSNGNSLTDLPSESEQGMKNNPTGSISYQSPFIPNNFKEKPMGWDLQMNIPKQPPQIQTVISLDEDDDIEMELVTSNKSENKNFEKNNTPKNENQVKNIPNNENTKKFPTNIPTNTSIPIHKKEEKKEVQEVHAEIKQDIKHDISIKQENIGINTSDKEDILSSLNGKDIKAHMIDLQVYLDKIDNIMWNVIVAIGVDGLSVIKEIKKIVQKRKEVTDSMVNTSIMQLRSMNIIEEEKINVGSKWFFVYNLSVLGSTIFKEKFGKNPVICEKQKLIKDHATATHGYSIKEVAELLIKKLGYTEITYDRKHNLVPLENEKTYIPDIIAKKENLTHYIEVELGHHMQKDFNEKCDKMLMTSENLFFVVPTSEVSQKILKQIAGWIESRGGKDALKGLGIVIYVTTTSKLSKGKWDLIYPI